MLYGLGPQFLSHFTAMHADGFHLEGWNDRQTLLTQKYLPHPLLKQSGMCTVEFSLLSLEDAVEEVG